MQALAKPPKKSKRRTFPNRTCRYSNPVTSCSSHPTNRTCRSSRPRTSRSGTSSTRSPTGGRTSSASSTRPTRRRGTSRSSMTPRGRKRRSMPCPRTRCCWRTPWGSTWRVSAAGVSASRLRWLRWWKAGSSPRARRTPWKESKGTRSCGSGRIILISLWRILII